MLTLKNCQSPSFNLKTDCIFQKINRRDETACVWNFFKWYTSLYSMMTVCLRDLFECDKSPDSVSENTNEVEQGLWIRWQIVWSSYSIGTSSPYRETICPGKLVYRFTLISTLNRKTSKKGKENWTLCNYCCVEVRNNGPKIWATVFISNCIPWSKTFIH